MSFFKKIIATLTGMEQAPNKTAAMERFRAQTAEEMNLAKERAADQRARMEEQAARKQVTIEVEEAPEQKEAA